LENMSDTPELNHDLIDLDWGDEGVVPPVIHPDTMFIFTEMAKVILDMVQPGDGELVVDVGCGRGVDVMEMAMRGMKAVGLDPSSRMVAGAKQYLDSKAESLPSDNNSGAAVVRGLGEALPFKERSLDKIICKGSLDHFADMERRRAPPVAAARRPQLRVQPPVPQGDGEERFRDKKDKGPVPAVDRPLLGKDTVPDARLGLSRRVAALRPGRPPVPLPQRRPHHQAHTEGVIS